MLGSCGKLNAINNYGRHRNISAKPQPLLALLSGYEDVFQGPILSLEDDLWPSEGMTWGCFL